MGVEPTLDAENCSGKVGETAVTARNVKLESPLLTTMRALLRQKSKCGHFALV